MSTPQAPEPVQNVDSAQFFELASSETLSPGARQAREAMLGPLQARVASRRTRRTAVRAGAAGALVILAVAGLRLLPATSTPAAPAPKVATNPVPSVIVAPPESKPAAKFTVTMLRNDPAIAAKYRATPPANTLIERMTDDQLLAALEAAGTPGYIRIGGKVVLSRDLDQPKPESPEPRSSLPSDSTHG